MCTLPRDQVEFERFLQLLGKEAASLGGVVPRQLAPVQVQPRLPRILHVHTDHGHTSFGTGLPNGLGILGRDVLRITSGGVRVDRAYLASRGLDQMQKILLLYGKDCFLIRLCRHLDDNFASAVKADFSAIIGPNLSAYVHVDHRVVIVNRAAAQTITGFFLRHGLPAIIHLYPEYCRQDIEWLTEYFRLNHTQDFLATGFDGGVWNNAHLVRNRFRVLADVQERIGRPLKIVVANILVHMRAIRLAADLFGDRTYLLGTRISHLSRCGQFASAAPDGTLSWRRDFRTSKDRLLIHNASLHEQYIRRHIPRFFQPTD